MEGGRKGETEGGKRRTDVSDVLLFVLSWWQGHPTEIPGLPPPHAGPLHLDLLEFFVGEGEKA